MSAAKAGHTPFDEKVIAQLLRYAKALNSEFAFATNGSDLRVFGLIRDPDLKTLENITYVRRHYDSYIGRQTREHLKKKRYWPQH